MQAYQESVDVFYIPADGLHFFVGASEGAKGLCVAHPNLRIAFDETTVALNKLSDLAKQGYTFSPGVPFEEFQQEVAALSSGKRVKLSGKAKMVWNEARV